MNKIHYCLRRKRKERNRYGKVKLIEVIEVIAVKGTGMPNDPIRNVVQYWTVDGKKIGEKENIQD